MNNDISIKSSPPTSPQRAQSAARQAERDQHLLGSPPSHRAAVQNVSSAAMVCQFIDFKST
jgi:hypothetical protein